MTPASSTVTAFDWSSVAAVLFDLDGVLTPTATVHEQAWGEMFDAYLASIGAAPWSDDDYFAHVDGKPRFDGVRDFLASRGITLPEGEASDRSGPTEAATVRSLGMRKNDAFTAILERDGVTPYAGSVALLDHLADLGVEVAVVSSSRNAPAVLAAAGLAERFEVVVSGATAEAEGIPGKPAPDMFWLAAERLGAPRERCVVVEDAVSGVRAGAAGGFAAVVGVDRGVGPEALREAGATLVVADLAELAPELALGSAVGPAVGNDEEARA